MTQPQTVYVAVARPGNGIATAGLVLGLVTAMFSLGGYLVQSLNFLLWLSIVPGLLAVIFGIVGLILAAGRHYVGRASAVWAIVLPIAPAVLLFVIGFVANR